MKYDFTSIINREGTNTIAVDVIPVKDAAVQEGFSKIPMWVADMSFPTAPSVREAMIRRIGHPCFGYFRPSPEYYGSIIEWHKNRKGVQDLAKENIGYENGVLGGLLTALRAVCSAGDKILVHSPTYIGFTNSMENAGYRLVHSPLYRDEQGIWRMDFEDMEEKIKSQKIHTVVFCSPHNPTGRVWTKEELTQAMELFARYDCDVISDEIWSDIVMPGYQHIPTQSVSEDAKNRTVALYAPSKTFSLAGLVGSYHVVYNKKVRERMEKEASLTHYNSPNVLSVEALIGAYSPEGAEWTDELMQVLSKNIDRAYDFFTKEVSGISLAKPQGTYMLFLDCTEWCQKHQISLDELLKAGIAVGVIWQDGRPFHGTCSIRMNLALPYSMLEEALDRLKKYVFNTEKEAK